MSYKGRIPLLPRSPFARIYDKNSNRMFNANLLVCGAKLVNPVMVQACAKLVSCGICMTPRLEVRGFDTLCMESEIAEMITDAVA